MQLGRRLNLYGQFNGKSVTLSSILVNKGKVWRIAVLDRKFTDEAQIKIDFNNLVI